MSKHLLKFGLWPDSKQMTLKKGLRELEELGYSLFYEGKNADLYVNGKSTTVLMVRSDRTSVFDVPLSDTIEGKGRIQNMISNLGYDFAESRGLKTLRLEMPSNIPNDIAEKSQYVQLAKPLTIWLKNEEDVGLELIFRKYFTGSLYGKYVKGEDPYGLFLPEGLNEWHKFDPTKFTPTTKGIIDEPLNYKMVEFEHPEIVEHLENLFDAYSDFAEERGIILVDTKFEIFGDRLGDEILTPESSRFILKSDFEQGRYISMDKQILRNWFEEQGYKKTAIKGKLLEVEIPQEIKNAVLDGYQKIYDMLSK